MSRATDGFDTGAPAPRGAEDPDEEEYVKVPAISGVRLDAVNAPTPCKRRAIPEMRLDTEASTESRLQRIEKLLETLVELSKIGLLDVFRRERNQFHMKVNTAHEQVVQKENALKCMHGEIARNTKLMEDQKDTIKFRFRNGHGHEYGRDPTDICYLRPDDIRVLNNMDEHPNNPVLRVQIEKLERELSELKYQRDILGEFSLATVYTSLSEFFDLEDN
jgi:hypothetical protein